MSSKIFTPTNQVRLTNVSVVRLKKGGKRFEIACYPSKVQSWRKKVETDIDEVLQTHSVFTNVSKGQVAKKEDILKSFGSEDVTKVCLEILEKGELQCSEKERQAQYELSVKEVADIVAEKTVNPETKTPYSVATIEKALKELSFSYNPNRGAKQQALEVIQQLNSKDILPIKRVRMHIVLSIPGKVTKQVKEKLAAMVVVTSEKSENADLVITGLVDPGHLSKVKEIVAELSRGAGRVDVVNFEAVVDEASTSAT